MDLEYYIELDRTGLLMLEKLLSEEFETLSELVSLRKYELGSDKAIVESLLLEVRSTLTL